jgi:hypothetical protein
VVNAERHRPERVPQPTTQLVDLRPSGS